MAYFGVIFFANMGGGGGQNYFHTGSHRESHTSGARGPPQFLKKRSENAGANENWKRAEYGFGEYGFKHRTQ